MPMAGYIPHPARAPQGFAGITAPSATRVDELLATIALGVTSGAVTTMLTFPKRRERAFKVLLGALAVDAILLGTYAFRYGGS